MEPVPFQPSSPVNDAGKRGPRIPGRRETTIAMPGDYGDAGMRLKIWANYPHKLANQIQQGDEDEIALALSQIVLAHNDWCDENGVELTQLQPAPFGAATDSLEAENAKRAFLKWWDEIPQELALAVSQAIGLEVGKLSVAVREKRRR